ncbi:hypothetical protein DL239_07190 [Sedimentitalea sp. CY04]|uniref:Uncharacterized protein n=1 Tax=Parasedimentitalea denitrificans TaxID=2211118 RepID=A0ABX0W5D1_9RHOB|nr:hypothetical protein [Sedimentitalea sp. CY04]NIZ60757.1 hypothetical protein [Sedimentitalea sp. CY04]
MFLLRILVVALIPANVFGESGDRDAAVMLEVDVLNFDGQANNSVQFRLDELRAMPAARFERGAIRNFGPKHLKGVSFIELMGQVGVTDGTLVAQRSDRSSDAINMLFVAETEAISSYE